MSFMSFLSTYSHSKFLSLMITCRCNFSNRCHVHELSHPVGNTSQSVSLIGYCRYSVKDLWPGIINTQCFFIYNSYSLGSYMSRSKTIIILPPYAWGLFGQIISYDKPQIRSLISRSLSMWPISLSSFNNLYTHSDLWIYINIFFGTEDEDTGWILRP